MSDAPLDRASGRAPNVLLLITDQQRYPCHWPDDPGWLRDLTPNDQRLADTGLTFRRAFCNTSMCSPSRATLLTGQYPAQHGVTLTHTQADLRPDPRNLPAVTATLFDILRSPGAPRQRAMRGFGRGLLQLGPKSGNEPELQPDTPNLAQMLRAAGLRGGLQGQVAPDPPGGHRLAAGRMGAIRRGSAATRLRVRRLGAARCRREREGRALRGGQRRPAGRRDGTSSTRDRPSAGWGAPTCRSPSASSSRSSTRTTCSATRPSTWAVDTRDRSSATSTCGCLPTLVEDMRNKPTVHELMRMGMTAYLGPLNGERAKLDYVNFYAHLHRVVDAQIGRLLDALGDPADPRSLRSRTVIFRCADHGEMGLSHGGLRQKAFNAYEETIHIPLVDLEPGRCSPKPAQTDAFASLIDLVPTIATDRRRGPRPHGPTARIRGRDLSPVLAERTTPEARPPASGGHRSRPMGSPSRAGPVRPGGDPLHVRRPPGGNRATERVRAAEPNPRGTNGEAQVRHLLRSGGQGGDRVRDVRPRARPGRAPQPGRPDQRRAADRHRRRMRSELGERLESVMEANGTSPPSGALP